MRIDPEWFRCGAADAQPEEAFLFQGREIHNGEGPDGISHLPRRGLVDRRAGRRVLYAERGRLHLRYRVFRAICDIAAMAKGDPAARIPAAAGVGFHRFHGHLAQVKVDFLVRHALRRSALNTVNREFRHGVAVEVGDFMRDPGPLSRPDGHRVKAFPGLVGIGASVLGRHVDVEIAEAGTLRPHPDADAVVGAAVQSVQFQGKPGPPDVSVRFCGGGRIFHPDGRPAFAFAQFHCSKTVIFNVVQRSAVIKNQPGGYRLGHPARPGVAVRVRRNSFSGIQGFA
ncbi:MAG: hypothetical protein BWY59_01162 [Verrucomicrobia bacterium ADurb.Bin345]|nr:MAG: hypothetical protein BWY59_01162 [Verrucomicrobia bacterium ADurb.Bin345]